MRRNHSPLSAGFTLVELSVVLVIIGIIVGGITGSVILVKQSTIKSAIKEYQQYNMATSLFRGQYNTLPGDMGNATDYWFNASTCPGTSGTAGGCNGDQNDEIVYTYAATTGNEALRAWQHLNLATFINGSFSGTATSGWGAVVGTNSPGSKVDGGVWSFNNNPPSAGMSSVTRLVLGKAVSSAEPLGWLLPPQDAYAMDSKLDDGNPVTGIFLAGGGSAGTASCFNSSGYLNAVSPGCVAFIELQKY